MLEGRTYKRSKVDLQGITMALIQASNMEIIDIGLKGISLDTTRRLDIGERYNIKLQSKGIALSLDGTVIWSRISRIHKGSKGDVFPVYSAGLEFVGVSEYLRGGIKNQWPLFCAQWSRYARLHQGPPHGLSPGPAFPEFSERRLPEPRNHYPGHR